MWTQQPELVSTCLAPTPQGLSLKPTATQMKPTFLCLFSSSSSYKRCDPRAGYGRSMVAGCLSFTQLLSLLSSENKEKNKRKKLMGRDGDGRSLTGHRQKRLPLGKTHSVHCQLAYIWMMRNKGKIKTLSPVCTSAYLPHHGVSTGCRGDPAPTPGAPPAPVLTGLSLTFFPLIPLLFPAFFPFLTSISPGITPAGLRGWALRSHQNLPEPAGTGFPRGSSRLSSQRPLSPAAAPGHGHPSPGRGDLPSLGDLDTWDKPAPTLKEEPPFPHRDHLRAAALRLPPEPPSLRVSRPRTHMRRYARYTALPHPNPSFQR